MRTSFLLAFFGLLFSSVMAQPTDAQLALATANPDQRLAQFFEAKGYSFKKLDNGQYSAQVSTNDGRSQLTFVNGKTYAYGGYEVRELYSLAYSSSQAPSAEHIALLLRENSRQKFGNWEYQVDATTGTHMLYFAMNAPAAASDDTLAELLDYVAYMADAMEQQLFKSDKH